MLELATIANLLTFSIVVSQHLFYAVALTTVSRALSAPAYVELRNAINAVMKRRVPLIYGAALATCVVVLALGVSREQGRLAVSTSAVGLLALLGDAGLMLRENVPINQVIETWTPTQYPADWATYRARWLALLRIRQIVLGIGFLSLLIGVVAR